MSLTRRKASSLDIWPGFVDALATLLMVIIFLLMIFVVSQVVLNDEILGRDKALDSLNRQISELAEMLSLERTANTDLRDNLDTLSGQLRASLSKQDQLNAQISILQGERDQLNLALEEANNEKTALSQRIAIEADKSSESSTRVADLQSKLDESNSELSDRNAQLSAQADQLAALERSKQELEAQTAALTETLESESLISKDLAAKLEDAYREVEASEKTIAVQLEKLADLERSISALEALKEKMEADLLTANLDIDTKESEIKASKEEVLKAQAEAALINKQLLALQTQLGQLNKLLEAAEDKDRRAQAQIRNLGKRLNAALASKVQELARYRSEFFGRLREILGNRRDIQIVGDRFIFQSEVLFDVGSDQLGPQGQDQLAKLATSLLQISREIPTNINWILQVEGHTDNQPIATFRFPSNWELSTARATSVVKFLIDSGIPAKRLSATGYGEFQPLVPGEDQTSLSRNRRIELKLTQR